MVKEKHFLSIVSATKLRILKFTFSRFFSVCKTNMLSRMKSVYLKIYTILLNTVHINKTSLIVFQQNGHLSTVLIIKDINKKKKKTYQQIININVFLRLYVIRKLFSP